MRMWKHALECDATRILIISPDTDVYNIGITLNQNPQRNITIQLTLSESEGFFQGRLCQLDLEYVWSN